MTLFSTAYFPNIRYMAKYLAERQPVIEVFDTYHKQTFRNRCQVMTANGVQSLSVPVVKINGNHTMTKDIMVSYHEHWPQVHRRCLESAYRAAPYFEHYYADLEPLFEQRFERLIDLNDAALRTVLNLMKVEKDIVHTSNYVFHPDEDYREAFHPKTKPSTEDFPQYYQVFSTKYPFAPDLSILDLIFNEGPESLHLINAIQKP